MLKKHKEMLMKIEVMNKNTVPYAQGEYIGRPSVLGNPFVIGRDGTREQVIERYKTWLRRQWKEKKPARQELVWLAQDAKQDGRLTLICHCKPLACHGDAVAEAVTALIEKGIV